MAEAWKVRIANQGFEAESLDQLKEWYRNGRIPPDAYIFHPVFQQWMYPNQLEELRSIGPGTQAAASAPARDGVPFYKRQFSSGGGCALLLLLLMIGVCFVDTDTTPSKARGERPSEKMTPADELGLTVTLIEVLEPDGCSESQNHIDICLALFNDGARVLEDSTKRELAENETADQRKLRDVMLARQRVILPAMRDAYGPISRKMLWEQDIIARTVGSGYRTMQFTAGIFASNRGIKLVHDVAVDRLSRMRFDQVQYRWYEGSDRYTYFDLDTPPDTAFVVWGEQGSFRVIE